ncbi:MAG TPA: (2Fe-2S)-binding protein [Longimicrobiales bacterium]|nr:(2Fe-2S)-binding protein [Longimicrobiales bacterium]
MSDTPLSEVGRAGTGLPTLSDPPSVGAPTPEPPWAHAFLPMEHRDAASHGGNGEGWSRRDFIKGIIASGVTVSGLSYFGAGCTPSLPAQTASGFERLISLNVNGQVRRVDVLPTETLAMTLRYKLGLTGTKLGCDRAECGACTVLIDDVNLYACTTLTHRVRDREVTTVEGLEGPNGELHPVQQAFVDELGPQCGFCTPGQVMSAVALLRSNPSPTREEARQAMAGNLCRCGAYNHYLNGVMRAASMREA